MTLADLIVTGDVIHDAECSRSHNTKKHERPPISGLPALCPLCHFELSGAAFCLAPSYCGLLAAIAKTTYTNNYLTADFIGVVDQ